MGFLLEYCPGGSERIERLRALYQGGRLDLVLAVMHVPSEAQQRFARTHCAGPCPRPNLRERVAFWEAFLRERSAIEDDSIPSAYLSEMDQGLYGGLVGAQVEFMCDPETGWISSMARPLLKDWSQFDDLRVQVNGEWDQFYREALHVFLEAARGRFGVSHFILIDGLNFIFELVGATQTYLSLIEAPERVRQAMAFAFDLNRWVQDTFFATVPLLEGGTCSNMAQWLPGRVVSESLDPFHMTSVATFEEWGRENAERMLSCYDGGVLHLHGNGRHLLEAAATLKGLKAIYLGDDVGFPPAFEVLPTLRERAGPVPLVVSVEWSQFQAALQEHRLVGGVLYQVRHVPDVATANRCMEAVRAYRA